MKLEIESKIGDMIEYHCDLTKTLDELAGLINEESVWKHYIMIDSLTKKDKCMAIRIPGGTVGAIYYNENRAITDIIVDTDYVVKSYVSNVNEIIKTKYIGVIMEQ